MRSKAVVYSILSILFAAAVFVVAWMYFRFIMGKEAEEQPEKEDAGVKKAKTEEIKEVLKEGADLNKKCIDEDVILCFVDRVTAHENRTFEWYINLNTADTPFEENDYVPYLEFKLTFDEAKAYRKSFGNYLRKNQWEDITVKIFICI